uniref:Uncharacterized protein n=1 Tax=Rhizophora mucronata TaxID=61149 RepID=A0A2P2NYI4_RHIMU
MLVFICKVSIFVGKFCEDCVFIRSPICLEASLSSDL